MKFLFVGLGNPGSDYEHTRHNIGFDVLDFYTQSHNIQWENAKFGKVCHTSVKGKKLTLLKPDTYMNLSGKAVKYWLDQSKIPMSNLLVFTDDLALPLCKLRLKLKGSDGGHNGLKSLNEYLQTIEYPRLRFGIGNDFRPGGQANYVLDKWPETDLPIVNETVEKAAQAIDLYVLEGPGSAMTKINAA